jgi:hypothetical protein
MENTFNIICITYSDNKARLGVLFITYFKLDDTYFPRYDSPTNISKENNMAIIVTDDCNIVPNIEF